MASLPQYFKKILFLLFIIWSSFHSFSQSKEMEAQAAYLLAEESFAQGEYEMTLDYLNNVKTYLGKTNPKILYLKILSEKELVHTNEKMYNQLMSTIAEFQQSSDITAFTQEKVLEVVKLKMELENKRKEDLKAVQEKQAEITKKTENFKNYTYDGWEFNIDYEQLEITHKDSLLFKKRIKSTENRDNNYTFYYTSQVGQNGRGMREYLKTPYFDTKHNSVFGVLVRDNVVLGYRKYIIGLITEDKELLQELKLYEKNLVESYTEFFGIGPIISLSPKGYTEVYKEFSWNLENKTVSLYIYNSTLFRVVEEIRYD